MSNGREIRSYDYGIIRMKWCDALRQDALAVFPAATKARVPRSDRSGAVARQYWRVRDRYRNLHFR
jgi:hypothetical protein